MVNNIWNIKYALAKRILDKLLHEVDRAMNDYLNTYYGKSDLKLQEIYKVDDTGI